MFIIEDHIVTVTGRTANVMYKQYSLKYIVSVLIDKWFGCWTIH